LAKEVLGKDWFKNFIWIIRLGFGFGLPG